MTYGDGDGSTFAPLSQDADVVAHELTHGVTEFTSSLIYSYESGALNEALSDIFGALVDRQEGAMGDDIWLLGEDIYTPGIEGDALRNMADPAAEGDYDYYPTRYVGTGDNGGVHTNSGIANLAFVLLVEGGSHPRGKTSTIVPGIDFDRAADIFYYANTSCLTASSNFEAARNCTAEGASQLYTQAEIDAVHLAWDAVGVPGGPPNPNATTVTALDKSGLSEGTGSEIFYTVSVPAGATDLRVEIFGGSGDADLYTRQGAQPTTSSYDCRPYLSGNNETCSDPAPAAGNYYLMIRGYAAYSDVGLLVSYVVTGEPENSPPVASFGSFATGLAATFTDLSTDSDGQIVSWNWDFGVDSATSQDPSPTYTYPATGTYTVDLTVTDNDSEDPKSATTSNTVAVILDDDGDGIADDNGDQCLGTPAGEQVDGNGCSESQKDDDGDGKFNNTDQCPETPTGAQVDDNGCSESQRDDDGDGVANGIDQCPNTAAGDTVDDTGCIVIEPPVACDGSEQRSYNRIRSGRNASFSVEVPDCATEVSISTSARRGNLDLSVGGPGGSTCNSTSDNSVEKCSFSDGAGGAYAIDLQAKSNVSKAVVEVVWH